MLCTIRLLYPTKTSHCCCTTHACAVLKHTHKDSQAVPQVYGPNQQVYVLAWSVALIRESGWCCRLSKTCLCWSPTSLGLCYQASLLGYAFSSKGGPSFDSTYVLSCIPCNSMYALSCVPCNSVRPRSLHVCTSYLPCNFGVKVYAVTPCICQQVCLVTFMCSMKVHVCPVLAWFLPSSARHHVCPVTLSSCSTRGIQTANQDASIGLKPSTFINACFSCSTSLLS